MNSVLISGANGFAGKQLIRYLENGGKFQISPLNLRESFFVGENSLAIVHLAGKAHDLQNVCDPDEYYRVNFELTRKLFDAFLISDASKFIFISSVKAAADDVSGILDEHIEPEPRTHYGKSKLMAERYIQSKVLPAGKSYHILRPCIIHGPGNKGNLKLLYSFASRRIPYPLASFTNKRSFLSIENFCFIINEILERDDIPSGIYNVADDEPLSTNEVVRILAKTQNKKLLLLYLPKAFVVIMAKIGEKLHLPLSTIRLRKLTENYIVCNDKIKKALKKELPVNSREGLWRTACSFKNSRG